MMTLGSNIRTARKKMGLTQEELASQIGVTPQAVSRWESSAGLPDISLIVPLAQILSVSTDTLFGLEETRQDDVMYMEVKYAYEEIAGASSSPAETAKKQCDYLLEKLESDPASYVYNTCLVERTAELSRYVNFAGYDKEVWDGYRNKAIQCGTQVIRFCRKKEWVERTHFALAWIYIHEKDFTSAREHIATLPSAASNRLQESILAQVASMESGTEEMKNVLRRNLQNFTRAWNKEVLYATESLSWSDKPKEAVELGEWGIRVMHVISENEELLPYRRGFYRDIYRAMLHADLRMDDLEQAARHFDELKKGMQKHLECYGKILDSEEEMEKYPKRQIRNMRAYTQEFVSEKQKELLERLREWNGPGKCDRLCEKIK